MTYTVGQLAKLTGLTVRALHHYDAIGLLAPSQRSDAGYRLYTQADVAKLFRIQALQGVGLSLADIGEALARGGATLPDLIAQQLATLDEEIEHAAALRNRLAQLQKVLQRGDEPAADDWVAAVELITRYGRHCSPEDLRLLIAHNQDDLDAWRKLVADLNGALASGVAATAVEARTLLRQWSTLLLRRVGGDINLAIKMKLAFAEDSELQTRLAVQGGITAPMMAYLGEVMLHEHRTLWARHLPQSDLQRLKFDASWHRNLMRMLGRLVQASSDNGTVQDRRNAYRSWRELLAEFIDGDLELAGKVEAALLGEDGDEELCGMWLLSAAMRELLRKAQIEASMPGVVVHIGGKTQ